MKRYILLFAILITAVFFYPVFAHAEKIGRYFNEIQVSPSIALLIIGAGLLFTASLTKRVISN